jgi:hypothetical protein
MYLCTFIPHSMVDSSAFDPDKSYEDSKLCNVRTFLYILKPYLYILVNNKFDPDKSYKDSKLCNVRTIFYLDSYF